MPFHQPPSWGFCFPSVYQYLYLTILSGCYLNFMSTVYMFIGSWSSYSHPNLRHYETMNASQLRHKIVKRGLFPSSHKLNSIREVSRMLKIAMPKLYSLVTMWCGLFFINMQGYWFKYCLVLDSWPFLNINQLYSKLELKYLLSSNAVNKCWVLCIINLNIGRRL